MLKKAIFTALTALMFVYSTASAATLDNKGTEFWLAFSPNYSPSLYMYITGDTATSGNITIASASFDEDFTVTPGEVTTVVIPDTAMVSNNETVESKGIHVTAADEVAVYGINKAGASTDAYMGLPVDVIGKSYLGIGYTSTQVLVVGTQDSTSVTVTPQFDDGTYAKTFTLNTGETYLLTTGTNFELNGSEIISDKPITVFSGSKCASVPNGYSYCDHLVEQMPPTSTWGKQFITVPLATRLNGDTFRFLASEDDTELSINGSLEATMSKGEYYETIITTSSQIESTKPILTVQFANGTSFDNQTGDPLMMLIPPYEQFQNSYTVTTPAEGFSINYANIVVPSSSISNVTFDNGTVPQGDFTQIGTTDFYGAQVALTLGTHNFSASNGFGIFTYGFDQDNSYGYPGGSSYAPVASFDHVTYTPPASATYSSNSEICASATAYNSDDEILPGISVTFSVTGANTTSEVIATDSEGIAEFCYTAVNAGTDTITWLDINSNTGSSDVNISDTIKTVTLSVTNGTFVPAADSIDVETDSELSFTVMPDTGYVLGSVLIDETDITQNITVTSNSDGSYTIVYANGVSADAVLSVTFVQETPAEMTTPELIAPATGDIFSKSSTVFTWQKVNGAEKYFITLAGNVHFSSRMLTSDSFTVSNNGVVTWICPVALSDGEYTWTVAAANSENTSEYANPNSFAIERPSLVTDLGDGDDIDFSGTGQINQLTLSSLSSLNASYPIHTETGLSVIKESDNGTLTVNTIAQVSIGGIIDSPEIGEIRVNGNRGTMTFHNADSFPGAVSPQGETIEASDLGLIIQSYDSDNLSANFDVTMLITKGASAGSIIHNLSSPVTFILSDLDLEYITGKTKIRLNDIILNEVKEGETLENYTSGYWYYNSSEETYYVTVKHFSDVTVVNDPSSKGGGGCSVVKGASAGDMGMLLIASMAAYILTRRRKNV